MLYIYNCSGFVSKTADSALLILSEEPLIMHQLWHTVDSCIFFLSRISPRIWNKRWTEVRLYLWGPYRFYTWKTRGRKSRATIPPTSNLSMFVSKHLDPNFSSFMSILAKLPSHIYFEFQLQSCLQRHINAVQSPQLDQLGLLLWATTNTAA